MFLKDMGGFDEFLPDAEFIGADEPFPKERIRRLAPSKERSVIVRGSHPNDHEGLVDVLYTLKGVSSVEGVESAIKDIITKANLQEVFKYSAWEGQPYDGKIRMLVARQLRSFDGSVPLTGLVVEHPHQRGTYIIETTVPLPPSSHTELERIVVQEGSVVQTMRANTPVELKRLWGLDKIGEVEEVLALYRKVQAAGFIPPYMSAQMEYGYTNTPERGKAKAQFFQARPFKKYETPPFEVNEGKDGKFMCFGATPPEGIVLAVRSMAKGVYPDELDEILKERKHYVLANQSAQPLNFLPRNFKAYVTLGEHHWSLAHQHFRWVRKAEVSLMDGDDAQRICSRALKADKVRVTSNGLTYRVDLLRKK